VRGVYWVASYSPTLLRETKHTKIEKGCAYYGRNKGKLSGQVPHCNFYFVALLAFLLKRFSIRFQFSNYDMYELISAFATQKF